MSGEGSVVKTLRKSLAVNMLMNRTTQRVSAQTVITGLVELKSRLAVSTRTEKCTRAKFAKAATLKYTIAPKSNLSKRATN